MLTIQNPLIDPPPREVALPRAPLIRVVCLVRFPVVLAAEQEPLVTAFQQAIRTTYPLLTREAASDPRAGGTPPAVTQRSIWRFSDEVGWRASLTRDFLALETTRYTSRADFLGRLRQLLNAFVPLAQPLRVDWLGVRYIDRVVGDELRDLAELVRPELAGVLATAMRDAGVHSLSDWALRVGEDILSARWSWLPPKATTDPSAIEPIAEPSWILDLDMTARRPFAFDADRICARAESFAARIYTFFRWAITDEGLRRYGGTP